MTHSSTNNPDLLNYYAALFEHKQVQIELPSGRAVVIARPGLGASYYLDRLGRLLKEAPLAGRVALFVKWLEAGGIEHEGLSLADLVAVTAALQALNRPLGKLAWDLVPLPPDPKGPPEGPAPTDYQGRGLARIVHLLAEHYGWTLEHILELPREVALAHAQECVLADRRRQEWEHMLSEIGWEYDKWAKVSRYKPLPPLPWEQGQSPAIPREEDAIPQHVREKYWPKGVIVDVQNEARIHRDQDPGG